jgi:hypothetical protein
MAREARASFNCQLCLNPILRFSAHKQPLDALRVAISDAPPRRRRLMQEDKPTFSLRWKIVLIACVTAGLSALLIAALSYYSMRGIARDKAIEHLAHETNVAALRVGALYTQMKNDLFAISSTAAVSSIITALRNGGVAPEDGATLDNLRARLSSAFAMVMKGRHHYTQMRYIGIADNGRELVRVNRAADGTPQVVQLEQLQGVAG